MKKILLANAWEIFNLSKEQGVNIEIARNMFCENLSTYEDGKAVLYSGADVDYSEISKIWQSMSDKEQTEAVNIYTKAIQDFYVELTVSRRENDEGKFNKILLKSDGEIKHLSYVCFKYAWDAYDYAVRNEVDNETAKNEVIEILDEYKVLSDETKKLEDSWYSEKVVLWDKGLDCCYRNNDRPLFEDVLATR